MIPAMPTHHLADAPNRQTPSALDDPTVDLIAKQIEKAWSRAKTHNPPPGKPPRRPSIAGHTQAAHTAARRFCQQVENEVKEVQELMASLEKVADTRNPPRQDPHHFEKVLAHIDALYKPTRKMLIASSTRLKPNGAKVRVDIGPQTPREHAFAITEECWFQNPATADLPRLSTILSLLESALSQAAQQSKGTRGRKADSGERLDFWSAVAKAFYRATNLHPTPSPASTFATICSVLADALKLTPPSYRTLHRFLDGKSSTQA
jgi:hypothetical protein